MVTVCRNTLSNCRRLAAGIFTTRDALIISIGNGFYVIRLPETNRRLVKVVEISKLDVKPPNRLFKALKPRLKQLYILYSLSLDFSGLVLS